MRQLLGVIAAVWKAISFCELVAFQSPWDTYRKTLHDLKGVPDGLMNTSFKNSTDKSLLCQEQNAENPWIKHKSW